jgi:acetoin:2,6-dichlorophenolindophenol oxidoreductase subunit alpha
MQKPGKEELIGFYRKMMRIRRAEEKLMEVFAGGEIPGFIHVCIGQEAAPVAVCSQLKDTDFVSTTHRGHGHALAKGIDLKLFMAELFGRKNGFCRGRSGSMHVADRQLGILGANGIVGGGIPIAVGAAFASRYKKTDQVTVCFFGDGATNEGTFHESLNLSSLLKLPIVYVCENNQWAQFTFLKTHMPIQDIAKRGASYDIPGVVVPNEFLKIREVARKAVERARAGEGPTLIEVKCNRWFGHFVGDAQKYREEETVKAARGDDCILKFRENLIVSGVLQEQDVQRIEEEVREEITEAVEFARKSPVPEPSELMEDLWA